LKLIEKYKAISFRNEVDFGKCLDYFYEKGIYFELPGDQDVIVKNNDFKKIKRMLKKKDIFLRLLRLLLRLKQED